MQFSQIQGQAQPLHILHRAIANGHLTHGYLFVGPEGVGKKQAALALAQYLNCQHPDTEQMESCGICPSLLIKEEIRDDIRDGLEGSVFKVCIGGGQYSTNLPNFHEIGRAHV